MCVCVYGSAAPVCPRVGSELPLSVLSIYVDVRFQMLMRRQRVQQVWTAAGQQQRWLR